MVYVFTSPIQIPPGHLIKNREQSQTQHNNVSSRAVRAGRGRFQADRAASAGIASCAPVARQCITAAGSDVAAGDGVGDGTDDNHAEAQQRYASSQLAR
jgi:hypothetical protein